MKSKLHLCKIRVSPGILITCLLKNGRVKRRKKCKMCLSPQPLLNVSRVLTAESETAPTHTPVCGRRPLSESPLPHGKGAAKVHVPPLLMSFLQSSFMQFLSLAKGSHACAHPASSWGWAVLWQKRELLLFGEAPIKRKKESISCSGGRKSWEIFDSWRLFHREQAPSLFPTSCVYSLYGVWACYLLQWKQKFFWTCSDKF